ncbi:MAG: hypothetical protein HOC71_08090 [Candidatus Latescibacteria bacterium]|nr:hypothetical protein [Candidatus Latescibacterota bacterium]
MFKQSIANIFVFLLIIVLGCASGIPKLGTGGRSSTTKIERTGHIDTPDGVTCYVCHKEDIPTYEFHKNYSKRCSECHVRNTWVAKKYIHPGWFLNVNHNTRCTRCHTKASEYNFSYYQCFGCHHVQGDIMKNHADRNIDDISNCIRCHKEVKDK